MIVFHLRLVFKMVVATLMGPARSWINTQPAHDGAEQGKWGSAKKRNGLFCTIQIYTNGVKDDDSQRGSGPRVDPSASAV